MKRTLFLNAKLKGAAGVTDLLVEDGVFSEIAPGLGARYPEAERVDLGGKLTLPPYVEPHIHLDYVYTAREPGAKTTAGPSSRASSAGRRQRAACPGRRSSAAPASPCASRS